MNKENIVVISQYMPGIYPPGEDDIATHLLAGLYIKSCADADPEIAKRYNIITFDFATTLDHQEVVSKVYEYHPKFVAYSLYMWNYHEFVESSSLLKKMDPNLCIVVGGPAVSYLPKQIMEENPQVDIVVSGDGESRMKAIFKNGATPNALSQIPEITYRNDDHEIISTGGSFKEDVTKIPSPYQNNVINLNDGKGHTVFIETFRGCPFECQYCIWGDFDNEMSLFPIDQILKDIEIIYNNPNIRMVYFTDANIFYTRKRAKAIIDKIESCKYKIPSLLALDILVVNEDMVHDLKRLPMFENAYNFGMQSTNPETLRLSGRKAGVEMFGKKIPLIRKIDPKAEFSFDLLYGLPGDNFHHFRETTDFALSLHPRKLYFSNLLLLPGTPYWTDKEKHGFEYVDGFPYLVSGNSTYSISDMEKTRDFAIWVMFVLYVHTIKETIHKMVALNPKLKHVDLIDRLADLIKREFDPIEGVDLNVLTLEGNNFARRRVFNRFAEPENCHIAYKACGELLKEYNMDHIENLSKDIQLGTEYYQTMALGSDHPRHLSFLSQHSQLQISRIKYKWIVSEIPKNKSDVALLPAAVY